MSLKKRENNKDRPMSLHKFFKKYLWLIVILLMVVAFVLALRRIGPNVKDVLVKSIVTSETLQHGIVKKVGKQHTGIVALAPKLMGFEGPRTYVLLFLNNTEIRPAGGFVGAYATVRVENASVQILAFEGTENLDARAPASFRVAPPAILAQELGVEKWYFRDANWSPDFSISAEQLVSLYALEGGVAADEIDAVIGVTPTVLEELLRIVGPVTVQGITFDADHVTERLEREVEFDYRDRGISFEQRKQIMRPFFDALIDRVTSDLFDRPTVYFGLIQSMIAQKHVLAYGVDDDVQEDFVQAGLDGRVTFQHGVDTIMWVDANLAALKTDHAIKRSLHIRRSHAEAVTHATMTYEHTHDFDWRTSRYRTYARLLVPKGSRLLRVTAYDDGGNTSDISLDRIAIDRSAEQYDSFGSMFVIEPLDTRSLEYVYEPPSSVMQNSDAYSLHVLKQSGTIAPRLTLDLEFATTIVAASPPEQQERWGDAVYQMDTDLKEPRSFVVDM
jgi:hypothetical protein